MRILSPCWQRRRRFAKRLRSKFAICSGPKCGKLKRYAQAGFEDIALWHESDISHSSVERVILPDSTILTDYLLDKTGNLVDKMFVYPERMRRNLELTKGLVFSGQLLLDLAAAGMLREQAYAIVQKHAMEAWENEGDFRAVIEADPEIR